MSADAVEWALSQSVKRSAAKFVLAVLAHRVNAEAGDLIAWPSVQSLCDSTGQDRKTVLANLRRLIDEGLIEDTGQRKGVTGQVIVYRLLVEAPTEQGHKSTKNGTVAGVSTGPKTEPLHRETVPFFPPNSTVFPSKESRFSAITVPKTGHGTGKEQKQEQEGNRKAARVPRFDALAHLLSLGVEEQIANDWLAVRKRKRAETTLTAISGAQREAEKANLPLNDALRICSERGWQGFNAAWIQQESSGGHGTVAPAPSKRFDDWHRSPAGIDRKARELGMTARGNESYDSFKERIWEELRKREAAASRPSAPASLPRSYHDERADTLAKLTGRKPAHTPEPAEAIHVDATERTRKMG
ncbi:MAG TPA: helix-turn-helix domain-containing protein [Trinickia sp.]|uniref:helix-turn-helix domain-containing protein n=1 Tax=Trinickia sp. TaxID=2571163 RepID=UPI002BAECBF5|nr:helix-turn-helix domain-containing protein [Trinickia sp.]HVW50827.1 helix-turn-helix domain-containing protein [Trinickia sp.]